MTHILDVYLHQARNLVAACLLLSLFLGSVVYEVLALDPRRRLLAAAVALLVAAVVFALLLLVVH